ncbi:MAG TPA: GntR family transcriptional regulator [Chromatiales bacterium]|nr:GntR family transcriptional regulator [Chromatiales bacterium]
MANTSPDPRTRSPRYVRVYTALREWIDSGKYAPGEKIASEEEIGRMFGVSRITTRKAIDLLVDDELVYRMHGKGTYISEHLRQRIGVDSMKKRIRAVRRRAVHHKIRDIDVSTVRADPQTCLDLKLPPDSKVLRIAYVRTFSGQCIGHAESSIPDRLGLRIDPLDLERNTPLTLLEKHGLNIGSVSQLTGATLADSRMAAILGTPVGSPVLRITQLLFDEDEQPVERFIGHYRADQYEHPLVSSRHEDMELVHGLVSRPD